MSETEITNKNFAGCLIQEKVGQGGMGTVYKARHLALNKTVCVKILAKELAADQRNVEFFMREAKSAAKLDHPNIVHVYSFGEEAGLYYIVMSYVEGESLQDILDKKKSLPIPEATDIIIGILEGLEHAHSKSIIHRDIKPSNILINKDGVPRIVDFGLARSISEEKQLTMAGEMVGTAYFMSPEQGLAQKVDTRADLYAVGATYFYLITGRYPFEGKSSIEVVSKHINEPIPNLYVLKPDIPVWTAKVIEKLMKKNPDERYQTTSELIAELKGYKEKNYAGAYGDNEQNFDLKEISTDMPKNAGPASLEPKDLLPGLSIDRYSSSETAEQNSQERKKKEITQRKKPESLREKKLQFGFVYKILKIIYHFSFLTLSLLLFFLAGSSFQNPDNFLSSLFSPFIKWTAPAMGACLAGFFLIFMASNVKPRKATPLYLLLGLGLALTAFSGANLFSFPHGAEKAAKVFLATNACFSYFIAPHNLWVGALLLLILASKISRSNTILPKTAAFFLVIISFLFFYAFSKTFTGIAAPEKKALLFALSSIGAAAVSVFFRGFLRLFFNTFLLSLLSFFLVFSAFKTSKITLITDEKARIEESRVDKEKEVAKLKVLMESAAMPVEYDDEGRPLRRAVAPTLNPDSISPKSYEELKKEAVADFSTEFYSALITGMRQKASALVLSMALFLLMNIFAAEEIFSNNKENY